MDKRENIYSMKGFKKVFGFTVRQTFKNKGYLISFIIFVLVMTFMGPIQYMGQRAGQGAAESGLEYSPTKIEVDNVYIYNQTPVSLDEKAVEDLYKTEDELKKENINKDKLTIYNLAQVGEISEEELLDGLKEKDVAVVISLDQEGYHIKSVMADESKVELDDADKIAEVINNDFDEKRLSDSDVSDDDIKMIFSGVNKGGVLSESDVKSEEQKTVGRQNYMFYMLGYSIIIFIVVSMSSSYIITSVTEEKQSKLVENLLVSVRPMALLMGKVLGMMSYVVLVLVCGAIGSNISNYVMKNVFDITNNTVLIPKCELNNIIIKQIPNIYYISSFNDTDINKDITKSFLKRRLINKYSFLKSFSPNAITIKSFLNNSNTKRPNIYNSFNYSREKSVNKN